MQRIVLFLSLYLWCSIAFAQESNYRWINSSDEEFPEVCGQAWSDSLHGSFYRLPSKAEGVVRDVVWGLSRHSAGLHVRFMTDAQAIVVRYKVGGDYSMPHMPTSGVSGLDIYAKDSEGALSWCRGRYSFGDTIQYAFSGLNVKESFHDRGREYRLYLPLYNSVEWLEIGIPDEDKFEKIPLRNEKPIVVYGTSIAQGACASRPGMAWTSILGRELDWPLINLGFSGNGRMEKELIDLLGEIDAEMYVLDCLPNLTPGEGRTHNDVYQLIIQAVKKLRAKCPSTPILLTEHAGYSDGALNSERFDIYTGLNSVMEKAYKALIEEGINDLHILKHDDIGLGLDSFVDGTHPSDFGMVAYAKAYESVIRHILNQPKGSISTTIPVTQRREPGAYEWEARHEELLALNQTAPPEICFFGNSIVHYWGGIPEAVWRRGVESWDQLFATFTVRNFGFGWDRVENILWRVNHGELDGFQAKQIITMLGTNNLHLNSDNEIIEGIELLIKTIKAKQAKSEMLAIGILPRRNGEERVRNLNVKISEIAQKFNIPYTDAGTVLLQADGIIDETLFSDGLHPNKKGYEKLAKAIKPFVIPSLH